jgi:uncharacterized protein YcaQ
MTLKLKNREARWLWLHAQGLGGTPTGKLDLYGLIHQLGFVQLDTIQVVVRAHHHIIWSRNQNYREPMLDICMRDERQIFEHFTHDASVLPMEFLPMWQRQFVRKKAQIDKSGWFKSMLDAKGREAIKARIRKEGALSTHAFDTQVKSKAMWARPPHKLALDYMWYSGELATSHRKGFTKFYDLAENIFPEHLRAETLSDNAQLDWLCRAALERLSFATQSEIQKFWDAATAQEVKIWIGKNEGHLMSVEIENADGTWKQAYANPEIETILAELKAPSSRLRILNPFDPCIRDRNRVERLFGFNYRNEMFVPAAKRIWGYYVYPILEKDRFIGRIELKADRKKQVLNVINFWQEEGVVWGDARKQKLQGELSRLARFAGLKSIEWF